MAWRVFLRRSALVFVAALLGLPVGPEAAAARQQPAKYSAVPYKLTVDYTGRYTYASYGHPGNVPELVQVRAEDRVTTYRATSKRSFRITLSYRGGCRRVGCLVFHAPLSGYFSHQGDGWERQYRGPVNLSGKPQIAPKPSDWCTQSYTEAVLPGKTLVTGEVDALGTAVGPLNIKVEPKEIGGVAERTVDDGCGQPLRYEITSGMLVLPPGGVSTEKVDLRRKLGRAFTIRYAPGALPDRRNRVVLDPGGSGLPAVTETYDFSWTLRFTPAYRPKRR